MNTELFSFADNEGDVEPKPEIEATETALRIPSQYEGEWEAYLPRLRARFPDAALGTLYCVYKLEQDPELTYKDFRAEANLRDIPLSGRSLHSAKVLLGLEAPTPRRRRAPEAESAFVDEAPAATHEETDDFEVQETPVARRSRKARRDDEPTDELGAGFESVLRDAIEAAAQTRTGRLREAIRQAIDLLQAALDDES